MARAKERDEPAANESVESRQHRGYVRYVNTADTRAITKEDLWGVGFSKDRDLQDLIWNASNQWCISRDEIPDDVYERAIEPDPDMILVEPED